ncbi:hypothetical protein [Paraburkholderia sp. UCT2]|uniref:hypothetical protein n=1 Tax=Paraburkholderia sp. UCT2 TaxID=2615208 RepID=UPI0016559567|nr:hypothetical protein [Paraburkholderia sp. UCT2]MBC8731975.1 hypothetical protein [Paraburkholderia sp. UCT2]
MNYETLRRYVDWVYQVQGGKENISIVVRDRDRAMIKSWIGSTASDSQPDTAAASSSTTWRQFIQKSEALEQVDK